jgi:diguanylate cyclase (GGDEF)-like protein
MHLRLKLFLGIVLFFTIALCFFGYIAYDSAVESSIKQENILLKDLSGGLTNDLASDIGTQPNEVAIKSWLTHFKSPQITTMVFSDDHQIFSDKEQKQVPQGVMQQIATSEPSGSISMQQVVYIWHSRPIPGTRYTLSLIHSQNQQDARTFLNALAMPLIFAALIIIWVAIWTTMFIAALLEKLSAQKDKLQHQAMHDALTSLPNRTLMQDRLQVAMHTADRQRTELALLAIDLNRFKEINDTLGHHCGDLLLIEVAKRLELGLRKSDSVARLGGDEFAIILNHVEAEDVKAIVEKLTRLIEEVMEIEGNKLFISASIGSAIFPTHSREMDTLLQYADVAMYAAKKACVKYASYSADLEEGSREKLILSNDLRNAVQAGQLSVNYQPKINIRTGAVIGTEALIRWKHPTLGFVGPDRFIPIAEQTGLMRPLTEFVLDTALQDLRRLSDQGYTTSMAINLSAVSLQDPELESLLLNAAGKWGAQPSQVVLEITETAVMDKTVHAMEVLQSLDKLGFKISMDDFGTGYSSLVNLRRLPIQELKVDRTFVMNMLTNEEDATIVRTIIDLGHSLGKKVVAEGVESETVLQALAELGCDIAQGYHISRPVPFETLANWLKTNSHHTQADPAPAPGLASGWPIAAKPS